MIDIVFVTHVFSEFSALVGQLELNPEVSIDWAKSSDEALRLASASTPALMIIDARLDAKSGLDLARKVILVNAGINLAVVSELPADEFHNASEGLGILAQLPTNPGRSEAERLLSLIESL